MATVELVSEIVPITRHTDAGEVAFAAYAQLFELLDELAPPDWSTPTECAGWRVRDMVGHMLGAAHANASLRENARQQLWGVRHRRDYGGNPLDAANALQIADHAKLSAQDLVSALRASAPAAISRRTRMPSLMRAITVPIAAGGSTAAGMPRSVNLGHLADVIYTRDVWMHTVDIARSLDRPLAMTDAMNRRVVADVVAEWAGRHKQPVDLILTGPAGGHYRSSDTTIGRTIECDAVEFCRIVSGREPGAELLATRILF